MAPTGRFKGSDTGPETPTYHVTEADLRSVQFLQCPQLETALNWQLAHRDEDLACGAAIPGR